MKKSLCKTVLLACGRNLRILLNLPIVLSTAVFFVGFSCTGIADDKRVEKISNEESVPYDFCGARSWQRGWCGEWQTGKGYTVCEAYLKYLNQSLPKLNVCDIPVPPKFKRPEWEEMDIKSNLQLAYEAEVIRFSAHSWYKKPDFESWKKVLLDEIATGKVVPIMKKTRITPTTKGEVTILAYTRDSTGCDKTMRGAFPEEGSQSNYWLTSGYAHFILTAQGSVLKINGGLGSVTTNNHEMFVYAGKPYFASAPDKVYPRTRYVKGLYDLLTMHDPNPDYLYTKHYCQVMTVNKPSLSTGK